MDIRLGTSSADEWTWNRGALITYFSNQARSIGNAFLTVFLYLTAIVTELLATPFRVTLSL